MTNSEVGKGQPKRIPVNEDLLMAPLSPPEQARLRGSKCRGCGEVFFGKRLSCENCGSEDVEEIALSRKGRLYTYTVIEHRPPGDYKGPDPFVPFATGSVDLPEGIRVPGQMASGYTEKNLKIGMEMELIRDKLYDDKETGNEVICWKWKPVSK